MSLSARIQNHRGGSSQFYIPEGFLEEAQLKVSHPDRKSGSSLKTQRGRVKEDLFLQSTQLEYEAWFSDKWPGEIVT